MLCASEAQQRTPALFFFAPFGRLARLVYVLRGMGGCLTVFSMFYTENALKIN
jgi:hypothetical protein